MPLTTQQKIIAFLNIAQILFFSIYFISRKNYEFILYIGVVLTALLVVYFTKNKVNYSPLVLWGLTLWAFLHFSGGAFAIANGRLYDIIIIPLSATYEILKYDQNSTQTIVTPDNHTQKSNVKESVENSVLEHESQITKRSYMFIAVTYYGTLLTLGITLLFILKKLRKKRKSA